MDGAPQDPRQDRRSWNGFASAFVTAALLVGLAAIGFIALLDPYGLRAAPGKRPGPLMDGNQRFMYPQIARRGAFDAAVFGSSTARLIDPRDLDRAFGARFANLAMNAATPWEQVQLAKLFVVGTKTRAALFALDTTWCEADADRKKLTFRPFPPWLYAPGAPLGIWRQANWQSLSTAGQVLLFHLGMAPERLRGDGYAIFTPPDESWDAARAASHIHGGATAFDAAAPEAGDEPPEAAMPALGWLDEMLAALPLDALKLVAFMPVNAAVQGQPGTPRGAREAACKARVAEIARKRDATVVDFRIPSPVTTRDENYWDALHYRLPIAERIVAGLKAASTDGTDDGGGFYRVLSHAGPRPGAAPMPVRPRSSFGNGISPSPQPPPAPRPPAFAR